MNSKEGVDSPVQEFYRGGCVFVTGSTGFVGKALVEKLLRACPNIEKVYLLIRSKKGVSPDVRCKELLNNPVFDRLRESNVLQKIEAVAGDVSEPSLGLSSTDKANIIANVTVVFHSAATVKFNETLQEAVKLNTMGTQAVLELCKEMVKLRALIHVSTAYSNAHRKDVGEEVYEPPANPYGIVQCIENLSPQLVEELSNKLIAQNHPNTYTITKNMAESIVAQYGADFPIAIVRPSIVTGAWQEPFPGWVDNVSGITGIMMEIGRGTIRSIICDDKNLVDIIPVDIVVDSLIVAAWHTANYRKSSVTVYNCTSGTLNPIRWHELGNFTLKHAKTTPSKYLQWYPGFTFTTNRFLHYLKDTFLHSMPAFLMDVVLQLQGSKPMHSLFGTEPNEYIIMDCKPSYLDLLNNKVLWSMMKICRRFRAAAKTGEFFALHEWIFNCDNQKALTNHMTAGDKSFFNPDVSKLNWDEYVKIYLLGIRKYVLKDTPETLEPARRKLKM
ncbi:hypothetical protein AAG570_006586 [Ranatra chinensis]|uniref:Fatty acyl-CoA reductase n=1 Tax=Ranatra chinensis TaxID=642074 RepID=A0ABD0ZHP2_9HEMI